jgi:hypothetical protein
MDTAGQPGGVWNEVLWLLMQKFVVQAYCALAGETAQTKVAAQTSRSTRIPLPRPWVGILYPPESIVAV